MAHVISFYTGDTDGRTLSIRLMNLVHSYKSRGVIVLDSLCVAEGLQYRVGLQQLSLQLAL